MPIVMIRPESPRVTGNPRNAMVCDTPYLQNEFGDPRFFYVSNLILSFSICSQSFKKSVRGNVWARTSLSEVNTALTDEQCIMTLKEDKKNRYQNLNKCI